MSMDSPNLVGFALGTVEVACTQRARDRKSAPVAPITVYATFTAVRQKYNCPCYK